MTEPGTRSPQVVRREFGDSQPFRVFLHNVPDHLLRDCRSPDDTFSTNASENLAVRNTSYGQLVVNRFPPQGAAELLPALCGILDQLNKSRDGSTHNAP